MEFLLALQFLTRVPVTVRGNVIEKNLARAMAYFPLIGLLLGLGASVFHTLLSYMLAPPVADLFTIAFLVIITGNMHGDGLMDTADGIYSGRPREGMLEIMKDSRVGSHGLMAGVMVLLAKFILLGQFPLSAKGPVLILVPALGRWAQVYGAAMHPYARSGGGTGSFTNHVGKRELFWASVTVLAAVMILAGLYGHLLLGALYGLILTGAVLAGTAGLGRYLAGKLGGLTGDTYGAMNECIELLALVIMHIIIRF